jgi:multidrug efflux pump subunit AcrB
VEVPEYIMNSLEQLKSTSLVKGQPRPVLTDVATVQVDTLPGEYDRSGPRRFVTVSANMYNKDLASATAAIQKSIKEMGDPPAGLVAEIMGESALLVDTLDSLQTGLDRGDHCDHAAAGRQLSVLRAVAGRAVVHPRRIAGAMLILLATGSTINLQSYMGLIMSTGTSVANAVLIVTNAEHLRHEYKDPFKAAA